MQKIGIKSCSNTYSYKSSKHHGKPLYNIVVHGAIPINRRCQIDDWNCFRNEFSMVKHKGDRREVELQHVWVLGHGKCRVD
jgi:hypothetical protein